MFTIRARKGSRTAIIDSDESTVIMGAQEGEEEEEEDEDDTKASIVSGVLPGVEVQALVEKAKFYTSLCMGTTAILAVFAFLFLIPFVVEPAISTILSDFTPQPVACVTSAHVYAEGLKNCSWSSCKEGRFSNQLFINYMSFLFRMFILFESIKLQLCNFKLHH